jgi:hypothetical protein
MSIFIVSDIQSKFWLIITQMPPNITCVREIYGLPNDGLMLMILSIRHH